MRFLSYVLMLCVYSGPVLAQPPADRILHDIPYTAAASSKRQSLDLYLPSSAKFPTILYVHEGSLSSGDKSDAPYAEIAANFLHTRFHPPTKH